MKKNCSAAASRRRCNRFTTALFLSGFIAAAAAGSLTLCSCARTRAGLQREAVLYQIATNSQGTLKRVIPYVPPPASYALESVVAAGGGLLALWAAYLQRRIAKLSNGQPPGPDPGSPGVPPPLPPAPAQNPVPVVPLNQV